MTDWQPIPTAPRDGSRVLVAVSPDLARRVGWDVPPEGGCVIARWVDSVRAWMTGPSGLVADAGLTHWAPPPEPPEPTAHQRLRDAAALTRHRANRT